VPASLFCKANQIGALAIGTGIGYTETKSSIRELALGLFARVTVEKGCIPNGTAYGIISKEGS
jgi:hypothetical protein